MAGSGPAGRPRHRLLSCLRSHLSGAQHAAITAAAARLTADQVPVKQTVSGCVSASERFGHRTRFHLSELLTD